MSRARGDDPMSESEASLLAFIPVRCLVHAPETSKRKTGAHVHSTPHRRRGRRSRPRPHGVVRRTGVRRSRPGADPRHERLPRPDPQQHDERRGRRRRAGRRSEATARKQPEHRLRGGGRPHRRLDLRVVHPARQAHHRRAQRRRTRGLGCRQPRARPGLQRPRQPGHGAVRRDDQPLRRRAVAVHRREPEAQGDRRRRRAGHLDQGLRRRRGRLRRRRHRGAAGPGEPRRHRRHRRPGDCELGQHRGGRPGHPRVRTSS